MDNIFYTKSYKFRISQTFEVELVDCPYIPYVSDSGPGSKLFLSRFAYIEKRDFSYYLILKQYFGWDGATWALDSKNFRRGSAVHDALLEMIGLRFLPAYSWKPYADKFLIKLCKEDGMWWPRRKWVYQAVSRLGDPQGSKPRKVYSAP